MPTNKTAEDYLFANKLILFNIYYCYKDEELINLYFLNTIPSDCLYAIVVI